jgi:hypothetical protein
MKAWYEDDNLLPEDRVDFELFPWHSAKFNGNALHVDNSLVREFVWKPVAELRAPLVFAFGAWWWKNLDRLGLKIIARLGDGGDQPCNLGYKPGARQGIVIARMDHGGLIVAEKHAGGPPGPPARKKVQDFKQQIRDLIGPES